MLTRFLTAGRMAAPEHPSRRNRVSIFTDYPAATIGLFTTHEAVRKDSLP